MDSSDAPRAHPARARRAENSRATPTMNEGVKREVSMSSRKYSMAMSSPRISATPLVMAPSTSSRGALVDMRRWIADSFSRSAWRSRSELTTRMLFKVERQHPRHRPEKADLFAGRGGPRTGQEEGGGVPIDLEVDRHDVARPDAGDLESVEVVGRRRETRDCVGVRPIGKTYAGDNANRERQWRLLRPQRLRWRRSTAPRSALGFVGVDRYRGEELCQLLR